MKRVIIAAVAENGVVGKGNKIPWRIPEELRFFRETTMGF
ncbi:MAG: dihydrofolate reductase, partial [Chlorobi bacterium]|nr:dihydrofolate reductase [Chlorobiota bacterium]